VQFKLTQFGNPILRQSAHQLTRSEIFSKDTQNIITNMRATLAQKRYGIGLAAPQIGQSLAVALVSLKPTPTRPNAPILHLTLINPMIVKTYGRRSPLWEGCISGPAMFAKVPRYRHLRLRWLDERGCRQEQDFTDLAAHVIQHEVDHLHGILFVDKVKDTTSYVTATEYRKLRRAEQQQNS
jgi:peptide deformylase